MILFSGSFVNADFDHAVLTVAVSANMQFVFDELKESFNDVSGLSVQGIIGSSGKLTSQIENGAPFDVFLSADTRYPQILFEKGLTYNEPRVYVHGVLVLWTQSDLNFSKKIHVLTDSSVKKIALANPATAPYGQEAVSALKYYGLYERVKDKFVYGESVAQTNQFIASGAADIGFTAKSVVLSPHMKNQGIWTEVDPQSYKPIAQAAVILKFAAKEHLTSARKFYDFLFSQKARDIFEKYGYIVP